MRVIIVVPLILLFASSAFPRTWHVPSEAPTIQAGIDSATAGDVVEIACATYMPEVQEIGPGIYVCIVMKDGVTLRSETGDAECVVIDARNQGAGISCGGVETGTILRGLTVVNGAEPPPWSTGGALHCAYASPLVQNCRFSDSYALYGGGVLVQCGSPVFENCEFSGNEANMGGGVHVENAIGCTSMMATFTGCLLQGNTADDAGGGLVVWGYDTHVTLDHCDVTNNQSSGAAGGIWLEGGEVTVTLTSCTVSQNTCVTSGGGVYLSNNPPTYLEAQDTNIADNNAAEGPDGWVWFDSSANLYCCEVDLAQWAGGGNVVLDNEDCGTDIGAATWGAIKAMYR
jgi:hypothetical protein